jgi:SAM-dependent methyltransferase
MLISENRQFWDSAEAWSQDGEEWSAWWGTSHAQWSGCLLPRIFPFLNGRILEIGPGRGRWTRFLQSYCSSLIGIDLSQTCVERCIERFSCNPHLQFQANDGLTLPMIESASIDFAFSFDSLVHAESDVMSSYANELARVLKPGAVAFLHHSNLDAVRRRSVLDRLKRRLSRLPCDYHLRATSMSAEKMRAFVESAGMTCAQQELVPWGRGWPLMIDCMSTIVNAPGHQCYVIRNQRFMEEAAAIKHNLIISLRVENIRSREEPGGPMPFSQSPSLGASSEAEIPAELPARPR